MGIHTSNHQIMLLMLPDKATYPLTKFILLPVLTLMAVDYYILIALEITNVKLGISIG